MSICKTQAFVLKKFDFGETSLIVRFFSKDFGKINCLFKGIRSDAKKFASTLELFSLNDVIFYKSNKNELNVASQCDLLDSFANLRFGLNKLNTATSLISLIDGLMQPHEANIPIFSLLKESLAALKQEQDCEKLLLIFQIKLLSLSGFEPRIDSCVICSNHIEYTQRAYFSSAKGGLLCQKCLPAIKTSRSVYRGTVASLNFIQKNNLAEALRLGLNNIIRKEISSLLATFFAYHLEQQPKSLAYA
ncbi:MAG: DNA repair protein RecO [Candidatus Omnitrophota bacterium]